MDTGACKQDLTPREEIGFPICVVTLIAQRRRATTTWAGWCASTCMENMFIHTNLNACNSNSRMDSKLKQNIQQGYMLIGIYVVHITNKTM